jgi:hypothetical protein
VVFKNKKAKGLTFALIDNQYRTLPVFLQQAVDAVCAWPEDSQ